MSGAHDLMKPRINPNGMTREQHVRQRVEVRTATMALMEAMTELRPHGRDYIGEPEAYERDLAIHQERFAVLDRLYNDLYDEAIAIQKGDEA